MVQPAAPSVQGFALGSSSSSSSPQEEKKKQTKRRMAIYRRYQGQRQYHPVYRASIVDVLRYRIRRRHMWHLLVFLICVLGSLMVIQRPVRRLMRPSTRVSPWLLPRDSLSKACTTVDVAARFDCHPDVGLSRATCERRGCCFHKPKPDDVGVPACFFPAGYNGYKLKHTKEASSAVVMTQMRRVRPSGFPEDASEIDVVASLFSSEVARLTVTAPDDIYRTSVPPVPEQHEPASRLLAVYTTRLGDVVVYRPEDRQILFETDLSRLVYTPRFVQLVTLVPTTNLYGLGLSRGPLQRSVLRPHVGFNRDLQAVVIEHHVHIYGFDGTEC
ncbi:hypothetical protein HPB50_025048 [Hyalomma asiaticum]|uniref:Uncharacterized protein n=1 Tax=Hyalomma asiaticum TaxID=266040 RepID=A0ACB7TC09_HYAAI|nr:hypothetical protein HPB50_025048 [Hyalomma asiaticum]